MRTFQNIVAALGLMLATVVALPSVQAQTNSRQTSATPVVDGQPPNFKPPVAKKAAQKAADFKASVSTTPPAASIALTPARKPATTTNPARPANQAAQGVNNANRAVTVAQAASLSTNNKVTTGKPDLTPITAATIPRLYALLICDTDADKVGPSIPLDRDRMLAVLRTVVDPQGRRDRVVPSVLEGEDATPERILKYLAQLQVGPQDSLMIYYRGHGAHSDTSGHELALKHGHIKRSVVRGAMREKNARLSVLLTDCCDNVVRTDGVEDDKPKPHRRKPFAAGETANWNTVSNLFFAGAGNLVDINACKPGQESFSNKTFGGFFSACFVHALCETSTEIAGNVALDWTKLGDHVNALVDDRFIAADTQTVFRHFTNEWPTTFFDRALLVKNESPFTAKLHVSYMPHGQNDWITTPTTWTVAPGKAGILHDKAHDNALVAAEQVRVWAESDDGKHLWAKHKTEPLKLTEERTGYADQQIANFTFRLK